MKRPNFEPIFTDKSDFCERTSEKPVETFVPNQSMTLSEMMRRFESGQRLNVHSSPMNQFYSSEEEADLNSERFEDAPPTDVHDISDVHRYYKEHQERKQEFAEKRKKAKEAKPAPAPQAPAADPPEDPAK